MWVSCKKVPENRFSKRMGRIRFTGNWEYGEVSWSSRGTVKFSGVLLSKDDVDRYEPQWFCEK